MPSVRSFFGEPEPEPTLLDEIKGATTMSYKRRLWGFGITVTLATVFLFLALMLLAILPLFATLYTLANIMLISSTFFLVGPWKQVKAMVKPTRLVATVIFIAAMILTLVAVFSFAGPIQWITVFLMIIIQVCALVWYAMSYVPFARRACKSCIGGVVESVA